jgi:hypothetical protein
MREFCPKRFGLIEQLRSAVRVAGEKIDDCELLPSIGQSGRIGIGLGLRDVAAQQRFGTGDVFQGAVQICQCQDDLTRQLRLILIFAQHTLCALIDHAFCGDGFRALLGDGAAKHASQTVAHRFFARGVAPRGIAFDRGFFRLPRRRAEANRQGYENCRSRQHRPAIAT